MAREGDCTRRTGPCDHAKPDRYSIRTPPLRKILTEALDKSITTS